MIPFMPVALEARNKPASVAAPVGGLNAKDSLVAMPDSDAVLMQNWWPQPYGCSVRKGYRYWATGMPSEVGTLAPWAAANGTQKLFAWSGNSVYDITSPGVAVLTPLTGLSNSVWEWTNVSNAAGSHLIALNGIDDGIVYNGVGNRIVLGDGIVANTWAGISPKDAVCPTVHQHRLWVVQKNSANGWFLPPDAIQGTFTKYDFGPLFSRGGFLQFLTTWTLDDGSGATDHLIAVSSRGEAVVYEGIDPEDDLNWKLTGVYYIGAPVAGRRAFCKAGGDQFILTQQGLVSMSAVLTSTKVSDAPGKIKTDKIQFLISEVVSSFSQSFGWDLKYYPKDNMLILNVPSVTSGGNIQLASNQITNAWTEFLGMDAACWGFFGSSPMFGDHAGNVFQAWTGHSDRVQSNGTGGTAIVSRVQQAYSYMGERATQKQVGMYRPVFVVTDPAAFNSTIRYDFRAELVTTPGPMGVTSSSLWGVGVWNSSLWGGGDTVQKQWVQAEGMGVAASLLMVMRTEGEVLWVATDYSITGGWGLL
jgi:hypothetical protein